MEDGVETNYLLDLNSGLSQVLSDGTHTYLYGLDRIAQYDLSVASYFLGDALGSVRQVTSSSGSVVQRQDYDPFGQVVSSNGSAVTAYGFAGEWTYASGLVNLRARYYAPGSGRFTSRDPVAHLNQLAEQWLREEADQRVQATVREVVAERFAREQPTQCCPLPVGWLVLDCLRSFRLLLVWCSFPIVPFFEQTLHRQRLSFRFSYLLGFILQR